MTDPVRTVHVRIEGIVQGVGFRAWTRRVATDLGLSGWVRNRRDGAVEAIFQGPRADVETMLESSREGPPGAEVTHVEIVGEGVGAYAGFEVRETV